MVKKQHMIAIAVGVLMLICIGIIVGVISGNDKDSEDNTTPKATVYDIDENTVEEEAEDGLSKSDSEEGPILEEEDIIDFQTENGETKSESAEQKNEKVDDAQTSQDNDAAKDDNDAAEDDKQEEASKDTGSWGIFY